MNNLILSKFFIGGILLSGALLTSCEGPGKRVSAGPLGPSTRAATAPSLSVVEVVRHYAGLTEQKARLASPASRSYADSLPHEHPARNSFSVHLLPCNVEVFLDEQQRVESVSVEGLSSKSQLDRSKPQVGRLIRLGELRQAFGPGKQTYRPQTLAVWSRRYPVEFRYQPLPENRPVKIEALMPQPAFADSAMVYSLSLSLKK